MTRKQPLLPFPLQHVYGLADSEHAYKITNGPGEMDFYLALGRQAVVSFRVKPVHKNLEDWECRIVSYASFGGYPGFQEFVPVIGIERLVSLPIHKSQAHQVKAEFEFYEGQYSFKSRSGLLHHVSGMPFIETVVVDGKQYQVTLHGDGLRVSRDRFSVEDLQTGRRYDFLPAEPLMFTRISDPVQRRARYEELGVWNPRFDSERQVYIYHGGAWDVYELINDGSGQRVTEDPGVPYSAILEYIDSGE